MPAPAIFDATQPHILGAPSVGWAHPNSSRSAASTLLVTEMFADGNPDEQPSWPRVDRESMKMPERLLRTTTESSMVPACSSQSHHIPSPMLSWMYANRTVTFVLNTILMPPPEFSRKAGLPLWSISTCSKRLFPCAPAALSRQSWTRA